MTRSGSRSCWERGRSDPRQALRQRPQEAPRDPRAREGLPRRGPLELQAGQGSGHEGRLLRLPRPPQPQARLPPPVDHAHQRRGAAERHELWRLHPRPQARRHRARPQGAGRHRRARSRDLQPICRCRPRGVGRFCLATAADRSDLTGAASTGSAPVSFNRPPIATEPPDPPTAMITSPHNDKLKEIRRLMRRREERFVAEGEDLVAAADAAGWPAVYRLRAGVDIAPELLDEVSGLGSGTRELAVYDRRWAAPTGPLCVALWGVRDPGNVGTVLRAALAFGADSVALGPDSADPFSPKAVRASMGAIFAMPVAKVASAAELPGARIALAAHAGAPLHGPIDEPVSI